MILKRIFTAIQHPGSILYPNSWCNEVFLTFLRGKGMKIGNNTRFINPSSCSIDFGRANYITIGNNCCLSQVNLIAHDYSWYVMLEAYNDITPDPGGEISIGNNCFIGFDAVILKDTHIGDNVIIGARSVVKGNIPSNTVWAGVPAKQICTLDEMYKRRINDRIKDAVYRRNHIRKVDNREASISDMGMFAYLFLERTEVNYDKYIKKLEMNGIKDNPTLRIFFFNSTPVFSSFEEFLSYENK